MKEEGPLLESLTHRLSECPADFLAEPRDRSGKGQVHVAAVVSDLLRDLGGELLTPEEAALFEAGREEQARVERNRLQVVLVASWLLHDEWFLSQKRFAREAHDFLAIGIAELASMVEARQLVADPDRREELARICLKALSLRPAGESVSQAEDRLTTLDSVERARVIREARAAEERARKIREEMARKQAEEAAATYARE
ncbi:MAG: hypothetical protein L0229_31720 [Blastocatellia bacterium]|nr:hypothetical protein [Blastocatellia bacterium]